ncbi:hypothetical protein ACTJJ0_17635 [Chitinophaga sp. 22321]|uniref:YhhN-like protein n=1 Tax=Chitinophaga hostae TaxID=2831022 RepID=A0ABS5J373_9BACT|nr:hypothetical protein [Chitinophaga hostae]MBS0029610.1 hypothetical protein [Chitinophaga hostae]
MEVYQIIFYIMLGIECLLLIPFTLNYSTLDKAGKSIYQYLISSIVFAVGSVTIEQFVHNNMWFFAIMYFIQFLILSVFYSTVIKNAAVKKAIKILPVPVLIIFILDLLKIEGVDKYNSLFTTIRSFVLLVYAIIFFFQLLRDNELIEQAIFINSLPNFWFNSGLFLYLCGSFIFSLSYNYLESQKIISNITFTITLIGGILQLILFYIGLQNIPKRK